MNIYSQVISIRWSDLDPNGHLRHSVYYDFGAQHRIKLLEHYGLTLEVMRKAGFGPVLFREECLFKKEIHIGDTITISTKIAKMRNDGSRWTFEHELINANNQLCALITSEGAWLDVNLRKILKQIPQVIQDALIAFPKTANFIESETIPGSK